MMSIDDLLAAISTLQRSDLESWIREELVAPQQEAGSLAVLGDGMRAGPPHLHADYELEIDSGDTAGRVVAGRSALRYPAASLVADPGRDGTGRDHSSSDHRGYGAS